jgi:DNA-binding LytR/AlgR family response regulator
MTEPFFCALVIDNEKESKDRIVELLRLNPLISEAESASDSDEALFKIIGCNPDVIVIEYPVKGKSTKELFQFIKSRLSHSNIIYISKTKEFAINAIQEGIFNYLLKPVLKEDLYKAISKIHQNKSSNLNERINQIIEGTPDDIKLKLQTNKGYLLIKPEEIIYCKANGYYTDLFLTGNRLELCFLLLAKIDKALQPYNFLRISRSVLINEKFVRKIYRGSNTIVLSSDGLEYEVKGSKIHIRNLAKLDNDIV